MQGAADAGEIASEEGLEDTQRSGATQETGAFGEAVLEGGDAGGTTQAVEVQGMLLAEVDLLQILCVDPEARDEKRTSGHEAWYTPGQEASETLNQRAMNTLDWEAWCTPGREALDSLGLQALG